MSANNNTNNKNDSKTVSKAVSKGWSDALLKPKKVIPSVEFLPD